MSPRSTASAALVTVLILSLAAGGDTLRNVRPGERLPAFSLPTLSGEALASTDLASKTVILVYVAAHQRRSESAAADALAVWTSLPREEVALVFVTADADETTYFRRRREGAGVRPQLLLDADRQLYGDLGLIVLPTTVVIDAEWRLAHVIASHRPGHGHMLEGFVAHAEGRLDDEGLRRHLETKPVDRDRPEDQIARRRATADVLRKSGMGDGADRELRAALEIDPAHVGARLDLAALLIALDRDEDVRAAVDAVLARDATDRRARLLDGILLARAGALDDAKAVLTELLALNADPVLVHYHLGLVAERQGDPTRAAAHFKASLVRAIRDRSP